MSATLLLTAIAILLVILFILNAVSNAFQVISRGNSKLKNRTLDHFYLYKPLHQFFFSDSTPEEHIFSDNLAQNFLRFLYPITALILMLSTVALAETKAWLSTLVINNISLIYLITVFFIFFLITEYLAKIISSHYPEKTIQILAPIASIFMLLAFPISYIFIKISHYFMRTVYYDSFESKVKSEARQELVDLIEESAVDIKFDPHDKILLSSVLGFKDRVAREVMVPRVDVFSLPHDTTIEEAAKLLTEEGYSRTPVFKESLDDVVGVLMYKDIIYKYMEFASTGDRKILEAPIESIVKNIIYTPETKKISHLLQEFKKNRLT